MKLFQLIFTVLVTAVIANAQLILGALAAIEIVVEIFEAAEVVATVALEANVAITGALETAEVAGAAAEEVAFTADITESGATLQITENSVAGTAAPAVELEAEVTLPNFTNAPLESTSPIGSSMEWTQTFTVNGQQISMDVGGSMQAQASVGTNGVFTLSEGGLSGLFADLDLENFSASITSNSIAFLTG